MGGGAWPLLVGGVTCLVDPAHHTRTNTHYAGKKRPEAARPGLNLGVWVRRACVRPLGRSCVGAFFFFRGGPQNPSSPRRRAQKTTYFVKIGCFLVGLSGARALPKNSLNRPVWLFLARALLQDFHGSSLKKQPRLVRLNVFSPGSPSGLSWVIAQKTA